MTGAGFFCSIVVAEFMLLFGDTGGCGVVDADEYAEFIAVVLCG